MDKDIPSPINLKSLADAMTWASEAMAKRPYRKTFFEVMSNELARRDNSPIVVELGSGPGYLADHILSNVEFSRYLALDFSEAMHDIARQLHPEIVNRVECVLGDFKTDHWNSAFSEVDVFLTIQAIHEARHKNHAQRIFSQVRESLCIGGMFLYCDHYFGKGGMENKGLFLRDTEKEAALKAAGFSNPKLLHKQGSLSLWKAIK